MLDKKTLLAILERSGESCTNIHDLRGYIQEELDEIEDAEFNGWNSQTLEDARNINKKIK